MWTRVFWLNALERAVKTAAQSLVAVVGVAQAGLLSIDWRSTLSVVGAAALASICTSIGSVESVIGK